MLLNRGMTTVIKGSETARTVVFPNTVQNSGCSAFEEMELLRSAILNEGAREIGSNTFYHSGLEKIRLSKALRKIEYGALNCE